MKSRNLILISICIGLFLFLLPNVVEAATCSALNYPTTKWQRVWSDGSGNCLGDGPDETNEVFDNNWGSGGVAYGRSDNVRFTSSRRIYISPAGPHNFTVGSDDGVRLYIDGVLQIDDWSDHSYREKSVSVMLSKGYYNFRIDYYEKTGAARVRFNHIFHQDQIDCSNKCVGRGYPGGECYSTALIPPPFMCLYCCSENYGDLVSDIGACTGNLVGCMCCHNCPSTPPISSSAQIGPCIVTITPRGWDCDAGEGGCNSNVRYRQFNKDTSWLSIAMDDNSGDGVCNENLNFENSWSSSGDQLTVTTQITAKSASHNLDAGFDISVSGTGCSLSGSGHNCVGSLTVDAVRNSGSASKVFDIEYCGDGECNCGETGASCPGDCPSSGCTISGIPYDDGDCNGKCQYCDISRSTTSWSNVPSGQVCYNDSLVNVFDLSGRYCNYGEDCSRGDCSAYEWWTSCNGSGSCRAAGSSPPTGSYIETVTADNSKVLKNDCSQANVSTSYYCETPVGTCITASTCNGSMLYKGCYNGSCSSSSTYGYNDTSDDSECDDVVCSTTNYCKDSCSWYTGRRCLDGSCDQGYGGGNCHPYTCSAGSCTSICSLSCGAACESDADCAIGTCQADCTCSGAPPPFDFSISVDPDFGLVIQGNSTSPSTVTATLISGTSQAVSFYISSGLPSGASASFNPSSCNPTCSSSMTISTLATTPAGVYQLIVCGTTGTITNCYSYYELTVIEAGLGISPPQVRTVPISEQGTVTTDSATIWGELTDMGGADSCLVWFERKKSIDMVWTEVCETTKTSIGSFSCDLTELTSNTAYDFEAFAKNGGSW